VNFAMSAVKRHAPQMPRQSEPLHAAPPSKTLALERVNEVLEGRLFVQLIFQCMAELAQYGPQAAFVAGRRGCSLTQRTNQTTQKGLRIGFCNGAGDRIEHRGIFFEEVDWL
jgi:hypothetical protein